MSADLQSERTTVKRMADRARYDTETIYSILDESYVCHVGIVIDDQPVVIPTLHARVGDDLLLHGSPASRMLRTAKTQQICVTTTLVDGWVLARSALHHSMNYRSVTIMGRPEVVPNEEKMAILDALVERLVPGRLPYLRPMTEAEARATTVLRLPITEASAKIRTGPPGDDEEDYELPIWAGVVPISQSFHAAVPDPRLGSGIKPADSVMRLIGGNT